MRILPCRAPATVALVLAAAVPLAADVTVTTMTTIAGGLTAATGTPVSATVVTRISGTRSRTDIDMGDQAGTAIVDTAAKEGYVLRADEKSAYHFSTDAAPAGAPGAVPPVDSVVTPTGKTRDVDGVPCTEYSVTMKMDVASLAAGGGAALPPEAAAMLKDVTLRISGSVWVAKDAPGAAEYVTFQRAVSEVAGAAQACSATAAGGTGPVPSVPSGMERLVTGFPEAAGIPYLTELTSTMEGSGQLVALMQKMGQMNITTRVTGVSTDPLPADVFAVPEGYKVVKQ